MEGSRAQHPACPLATFGKFLCLPCSCVQVQVLMCSPTTVGSQILPWTPDNRYPEALLKRGATI